MGDELTVHLVILLQVNDLTDLSPFFAASARAEKLNEPRSPLLRQSSLMLMSTAFDLWLLQWSCEEYSNRLRPNSTLLVGMCEMFKKTIAVDQVATS